MSSTHQIGLVLLQDFKELGWFCYIFSRKLPLFCYKTLRLLPLFSVSEQGALQKICLDGLFAYCILIAYA